MKINRKVVLIAVMVVAVTIPVLGYASPKEWLVPFMTNSEYTQLPSDKKEDIDNLNERIQNAKNGKIPQADAAQERAKGAEKIPDAPFATGFQTPEAPPGIQSFNTISLWQGTLDNKQIRIYAGYFYESEDTNDQGGIVLQSMDITTKHMEIQKIVTDEKHGSLTIQNVEEKSESPKVQLQAEDGTEYEFDLTKKAFKLLNSQG